MASKKSVFIFLFFFLLSVYALSFSTTRSNRNIGEGDKRIAVIESLISRGSIGLDYNLGGQMVKGREGKYYNYHEFGQNFFVLPVFFLTQNFFKPGFPFFIINAISTSLSCVILCGILSFLGYTIRTATLTSLICGIATLAWFYGSKVPFEHPIVTCLILGAFYFSLRGTMEKNNPISHFLLAGILVGIGIATRIDVVLVIIPLVILILMHGKDNPQKTHALTNVLIFSLAAIPGVVFSLYYNYVRFGSIWQTGYQLIMRQESFALRFMPLGAAGLLLSPGKSILLFQPILFIVPFCIRDFHKKTPRHFFYALCSLIITYFLFYSSYVDWHGDWCWGPRYLLVITPFLVMFLAAFFETWSGKSIVTKSLAVFLIGISIFVQILPVISNFYISLAMKFSRYPDWNSFTSFRSYFSFRDSAIVSQFDAIVDTLELLLNPDHIYALLQRLESSGEFYVLRNLDLYRVDLWWMQEISGMHFLIAALIAGVALYCFWKIKQTLRINKVKS